MLRRPSIRSAPAGSSLIAAKIASAAMAALDASSKALTPTVVTVGATRLTHWSTIVTTARTELYDRGRKRRFAASTAGTRASFCVEEGPREKRRFVGKIGESDVWVLVGRVYKPYTTVL